MDPEDARIYLDAWDEGTSDEELPELDDATVVRRAEDHRKQHGN